MHLIPKPKQLQLHGQTCSIHQGFNFTGPWADCAAQAHGFGIPLSSQGISVNVYTEEVQILQTALSAQQPCTEEIYRLEIKTDCIDIYINASPGFFAAMASLYQIVQQQTEGSIPTLSLFDYPLIPYRGIMVDVSRGKIPNRKTFKRMVNLCFSHKLNILQLYWEDCYQLKGHNKIGVLNGFYNQQEVAWMESLCSAYGIELQANIQTFSHMHGILRVPGYEHLAENETLFTLAAGNPDVYDFLDDMLGQVLPWFSSRTVHLNMDEAYDLGTGYSKKKVCDKGKEQIYSDHIKKVCDIARNHGAKKLLMWGDALVKYPNLQNMVDDDVVFVDWSYNPQIDYPSLENHDGNRKEFWIAPGTSSWNAIFPRVQNAQNNINQYISQAMKHSVRGVLITHWGDYGHHQPFSFSYLGFIYAAEQAYNGGTTDIHDFEEACSKLVYTSTEQKEAFTWLSRTNELPAIQLGFKSQSLYSLFDDMFKGLTVSGNDCYPAIPEESFKGFIQYGQSAIDCLQSIEHTTNFDLELMQAARMLVLTGKKGVLFMKIRSAFADGGVNERQLLSWIYDIKLLFAEFSQLREAFARLWEDEALITGREGALYLFDKAATRFDEAVRYLASQRVALLHLEPLDIHMEHYHAHEGYTTLWTMDCANLWDRAYPWR